MMMFFSVTAIEESTTITVSNISSKTLRAIIHRVFRSKVNTYMFTKYSYRSLTFFKFFALEFYNLIDILCEERPIGLNVKECEKIKEQLLTNTWMKSTIADQKPIVDLSNKVRLRFDPLDYQTKFIQHFSDVVTKYGLRGTLLGADPGTGKTYTSLLLAECLDVERIVVFTPLNALDRVWLDNTRNPSTSLYKSVQTVWSSKDNKDYRGERIAIYHYESLNKALENYREYVGKRTLLIVDELHNLNEINSTRTNNYVEFCKKTKCFVLPMSGTPLKALGTEVIPHLRAFDPLFTEAVELRFKKIFSGSASFTHSILVRRINKINYRVTSTEANIEQPLEETIKIATPDGDNYTLVALAKVMKEYIEERTLYYEELMPEAIAMFNECVTQAKNKMLLDANTPSKKTNIEFMFTDYLNKVERIKKANKQGSLAMIPEVLKEATAFEKTYIIPNLTSKEMRDTFKDIKSIVKYVELKIRGECLGRVLGRARIDAHISISRHIEYQDIIDSTAKKTLIFTTWQEVANAAITQLRELGYDVLSVYGDETKNLASIVSRFETDKNANPLVATYASLSTAVPLVMADTMIIINPPFRDYVMRQTVARIARKGATTQTRIFNIILDTGDLPNISSRNVDIMQWSRDQVNFFLGLKEIEEDDVEEKDDQVALEAAIMNTEDLTIKAEFNKLNIKPFFGNW